MRYSEISSLREELSAKQKVTRANTEIIQIHRDYLSKIQSARKRLSAGTIDEAEFNVIRQSAIRRHEQKRSNADQAARMAIK